MSKIIAMDDNGYPFITNVDPTSVPAPASSPPPGISVNGAVGATSTAYARADHTHASSVQRTKFAISTGGVYTWTFTTAYSTPPIVTYGVVNSVSPTQPLIVNMTGDPTTTSVSFKVFQAGTVTVGALGAVVNIFSAAATGTSLHCWAALPTA